MEEEHEHDEEEVVLDGLYGEFQGRESFIEMFNSDEGMNRLLNREDLSFLWDLGSVTIG